MKLKKYFPQLLVILIVFMLLFLTNQRTFPHDSFYYFEAGKTFNFSLYQDSLRGYFFPFFLHNILNLADFIHINYILVFWFIFSIIYGISLFEVIPNFFEKIFDLKFNNLQKFIFSILVLFFWNGLIIYPLTDALALITMVQSVLILINVKIKKKNLLYFISGLCIAISCNLRPIYLISLILIVILLIRRLYTKKNFLQSLCFVLGFLIIVYPQIVINKREFNTLSPLVQAKYVTEQESGSLYLRQLFWGIQYNKYETNINKSKFKKARVFFIDKIGIKILESNQNLEVSYKNYLKIILKYPIDMSIIYFKHIFNGMDHTFPEIYIKNIYRDRVFFSAINYSLWFLGILSLIVIIPKSKKEKKNYLLIYTAPALLAIPTAIEPRFFLSLHLIIYFLSIYSIANFLQKKNFEKVLIIKKYIFFYLLFLFLCFVLSSYVFLTISDSIIIYNNF